MASNAEFTKLSADVVFAVVGRELIAALARGEDGTHQLAKLREARDHEHNQLTFPHRIAALARELGDALVWGNPTAPIIAKLAKVCDLERRGGRTPNAEELEAMTRMIKELARKRS